MTFKSKVIFLFSIVALTLGCRTNDNYPTDAALSEEGMDSNRTTVIRELKNDEDQFTKILEEFDRAKLKRSGARLAIVEVLKVDNNENIPQTIEEMQRNDATIVEQIKILESHYNIEVPVEDRNLHSWDKSDQSYTWPQKLKLLQENSKIISRCLGTVAKKP